MSFNKIVVGLRLDAEKYVSYL